jgi:ArsR family transcriptional regulator
MAGVSSRSTGDPQRCAPRLRALADPTRLAVLRRLAAGPLHVGELVAAFAVEQSLMSHHLRALRDAGLVVSRRDGRCVRYHLAEGVLGRDASVLRLGCCDISFRPG